MSKLLEIEAHNFVTYKHFRLNLKSSDSIFISGKNLDASSIDSNGSGKSLIYDALLWGLYDTTIRGFSKDQVIGRFANDAWVKETWLDDENRKIVITRYRNHIKYKNNCTLFIDGKDATKVTNLSKSGTNFQISKILGIDSISFLHSIVFSRNRKSICDENEGGRRKLLSHILNLDKFDEAMKNARTDKKELTASFNTLKIKENTLKTRINELKIRIRQECAAVRDEEERVQHERKLVRQEQSVYKKNILNAEANIKSIKNNIRALKTRISDQNIYKNKLQRLNHINDVKEEKLFGLEFKYNNQIKIIKDYYDKIDNVISGRDKICSLCNQKITVMHVRRETYRLKTELSEYKINRTMLKKRLSKVKFFIEENNKLIEKYQSKIDTSLEIKMAHLQGELHSSENNLAIFKNKIKIKEVTTNIGKLEATRDNTRKQLRQTIQDLKNVIAKKSKVTNALEISDFWISGFSNKGIKSFIINGILDYLEKTANEYLYEMTEGYIKINWISEQEQKTTGKAVDKLILNVKTGKRGNKEYHHCSDGEKSRIWLAMELALNAVIRSTIDLALIDEVFDGLDAVGVRRAMGLLQNESSKRKILCISHRKEMEKLFKVKKTVIMENDESRLDG